MSGSPPRSSHWGPRFTVNGVTPADFERVIARLSRTGPTGVPPGWPSAPSTRRSGREALAEGRTPVGRRAPRPGRGLLPLRQVRLRRGPRPDAGGARARRRLLHRRAAPPRSARSPGRDPVRDRPAGRRRSGRRRRRAAPGRRTPDPGLDSTKEELRSTEETFLDPRPGDLSASTARVRARRSTTCRSAATGRRSPRRSGTRSASCPTLDRDRLGVWGVSLGGYYAPRVAAALGDRATACVALAGPFNFGECWDGPAAADPRHLPACGRAPRNDDEARQIALTLGMAQVAGRPRRPAAASSSAGRTG